MIFQMKFDFIADPGPDKTAGNRTAKSPVIVLYAIGHLAFQFQNLEVNNKLLGLPLANRSWNKRRRGQFGNHLLMNRNRFSIFIRFRALLVDTRSQKKTKSDAGNNDKSVCKLHKIDRKSTRLN